MKKLSRNAQVKLSNALIESVTESIHSELKSNATTNEMEEIFEYLLRWYEESPELFTKFINSKSDAVKLEASDCEKVERDFHEFIILNQV